MAGQGKGVPAETRDAIEWLVHEWARAIDEDRLEDLGTLMTEGAQYKVASRFNVDRKLPAAVIHCRNRSQLLDRISSMRVANIYEKHHYRHIVSGVQVLGPGKDAGTWETRANYIVVRTMEHDGAMTVYSCGQYRDVVAFEGGEAKLACREVIYDSRIIETVLVIPL
jgi:anthranilate 1,2-dioxygenase small subunit